MAHILVVEDDENIVRLLQIRLEQVGHSITAVMNGRDAIAKARELLPDVVLLDVMLPEMNGLEVAKRLKHDPLTKNIPIIMLTARSEGSSVMAGLDAGANAYLVKPIHFPDLIRRIENFVNHAAVV